MARFRAGTSGAILLAVYVVAGLALVAVHRDLPIVRNSLVYAQIIESMLVLGADFDTAEHSYNKALGFPILSLPIVAALGANTGLKVASFLFTAAWALSIAVFVRRLAVAFPIAGDGPDVTSWALAISLLSPLVFYQFASAYPDSLNALCFLWALYFVDRATSESPRRHDWAAFACVALIGIWVKHHGFIVLALAAVFVASRFDRLRRRWRTDPRDRLRFAVSIGLLLLVLSLAQGGLVPGFNLGSNVGNYTKGFDAIPRKTLRNLPMLATFLVLSFGVLTPFLFRLREIARHREWYLALALFLLSVVVYPGARYNMRYYLPIVPLLAWVAVGNLSRLRRPARRVLLGAFVAIQLLGIGYYNSFAVHDRVSEAFALPSYENLRLVRRQREMLAVTAAIARNATGGRKTMYFVSNYYGDGKWGVWEREGLFPADLRVFYAHFLDWDEILTRMRASGSDAALLYCGDSEVRNRAAPRGVALTRVAADLYLLDLRPRSLSRARESDPTAETGSG